MIRRVHRVVDHWVGTVDSHQAAHGVLVTMLLEAAQPFGNDRVLG